VREHKMGNNDENKEANANRGKDSGDDASPPSSSSPQISLSHYFNNLVSRTLLWNQGASLFSGTANNQYNLPIMKPALTPDMIPFTPTSPIAFAQRASGNEIKEGHDAVVHTSSNRPNALNLKLKADRRKKNNSSTASSPPDNAVNLSGEYKGGNNQEANSDKLSFHKKTAGESAAVKEEGEETSASRTRNTNVVPSKLSIGNKTTPTEYSSSSSSSIEEISKVRQSERSAYSEISPAKLTQASRIDKNGRPIDVTIHIGRIEVKAIQQVESQHSTPSFPAAAADQRSFSAGPKSTAPHMTLNDYLRKRAEGKY
jgi:hypothetical protein